MRPLFPLVRQQVKAVELGNWFATRGYQKTQAGVLHRPDELIVLVLSYNTNALSIVLFEQWKLEWSFDSVRRMTTWKHGSFEWLQIDFSDPPTWHKGKAVRINQVTGKRARNQGFMEGTKQAEPPEDCQVFAEMDQDGTYRPITTVHLALHTMKKKWIQYFLTLTEHHLLPNYELGEEAFEAAEGPKVAPFSGVALAASAPLCSNCDDDHSEAQVRCEQCAALLCYECDLILHRPVAKSAHQRRIAVGVRASMRDKRRQVEPCSCQRQADCPCEAEMVYCALECRCGATNKWNYANEANRVHKGRITRPVTTVAPGRRGKKARKVVHDSSVEVRSFFQPSAQARMARAALGNGDDADLGDEENDSAQGEEFSDID